MNLDTEVFIQMAYAVGVGLLIGLERSLGQHGRDPEPEAGSSDVDAAEPASPKDDKDTTEVDYLGLRSFGVLSLFGFGAALVAEQLPLVAPVALAGAALLVVAMYRRATQFGLGITTEAAAMATCVLGMVCRYNPEAAAVIALVLTVLLAAKRMTYGTIRKMRRVELTDTLKFLVVILIVLPLLPDRDLDPYGAFNPHKVGFLVVLISGISFVGYFLTRILGAKRGLGITGILGGLTSSTAVTAAMAVEAKRTPDLRAICTFSTIAANATMFVRVLVVVGVLDRPLLYLLAWPLGAMAAVAAVAAGVFWIVAGRRKPDGSGGSVKLKNPFSVGPALKFAAFFVAILFVAKLANTYFGESGLFVAAILSGLADVDAITLSITEQSSDGSLARSIGAIGITIAVVSNSVVKTGIALYSGGWKFGRLVGLCLGLATVAGLVVAFALE